MNKEISEFLDYLRHERNASPHTLLGYGRDLREAAEYAGGSGMVVRGGMTVFQWGDTAKRYDLKSTTKSIGSAALGLAIQDRLIALDDKIISRYPAMGVTPGENRSNPGLEEITFLHLATQTAGFDKPGGYVPLLFRPGTQWAYSDSGPNWIADALTYLYRRDLKELLFERVFARCEHMSAEDVYVVVNTEGSRASKATVYNTLGLFEEGVGA